jgi:hypothetical protein
VVEASALFEGRQVRLELSFAKPLFVESSRVELSCVESSCAELLDEQEALAAQERWRVLLDEDERAEEVLPF